MRIAAIQMVSETDINTNLERAAHLLSQAVAAGAELAVLPENFACYGRGGLRIEGERESHHQGPILPFLRSQARDLGLWLVGGTVPLVHAADGGLDADGDRIFAATCVFDSRGEWVGRYDKIHLFDAQVADSVGAYKESTTICPGAPTPRVLDSPWGRLGLSVCYDLRFPEYYRQLAEAGAEILLIPAAFTYTTGAAHWEVLLRARAIETQCFVVAANQGGWHKSKGGNKRRTYGHSMIVHPWGLILSQQAEGEGVVIADIDMHALREVRERMPVARHRRL